MYLLSIFFIFDNKFFKTVKMCFLRIINLSIFKTAEDKCALHHEFSQSYINRDQRYQ